MKKLSLLILAFTFFMCSCGLFHKTEERTDSVSLKRIPNKELTHEDRVKGVTNLLLAVQSSYEDMMTLSANTTAPSKGIKVAQKVEKKYSARITEITSLNFDSMSDEELNQLTTELSTIITSIREARDLLNNM